MLSKFKKIFLFQIKDECLIKEFKMLLRELTKINDDRNKFEHSLWFFNEGELLRFKVKSSIKIEPILFDRENLQVSDIEKLNVRIIAAVKKLRSLSGRARKTLTKKKIKK